LFIFATLGLGTSSNSSINAKYYFVVLLLSQRALKKMDFSDLSTMRMEGALYGRKCILLFIFLRWSMLFNVVHSDRREIVHSSSAQTFLREIRHATNVKLLLGGEKKTKN